MLRNFAIGYLIVAALRGLGNATVRAPGIVGFFVLVFLLFGVFHASSIEEFCHIVGGVIALFTFALVIFAFCNGRTLLAIMILCVGSILAPMVAEVPFESGEEYPQTWVACQGMGYRFEWDTDACYDGTKKIVQYHGGGNGVPVTSPKPAAPATVSKPAPLPAAPPSQASKPEPIATPSPVGSAEPVATSTPATAAQSKWRKWLVWLVLYGLVTAVVAPVARCLRQSRTWRNKGAANAAGPRGNADNAAGPRGNADNAAGPRGNADVRSARLKAVKARLDALRDEIEPLRAMTEGDLPLPPEHTEALIEVVLANAMYQLQLDEVVVEFDGLIAEFDRAPRAIETRLAAIEDRLNALGDEFSRLFEANLELVLASAMYTRDARAETERAETERGRPGRVPGGRNRAQHEQARAEAERAETERKAKQARAEAEQKAKQARAEEESKLYFPLLKLRQPFTQAQVRTAYKQAAKRLHPDVGGTNAQMVALNDERDNALLFAA